LHSSTYNRDFPPFDVETYERDRFSALAGGDYDRANNLTREMENAMVFANRVFKINEKSACVSAQILIQTARDSLRGKP
jgi:hypothetical protein